MLICFYLCLGIASDKDKLDICSVGICGSYSLKTLLKDKHKRLYYENRKNFCKRDFGFTR